MNYIAFFLKEWYIMYRILLIAPHFNSTKILIDLSYPTLHHVYSDCSYIIINVKE